MTPHSLVCHQPSREVEGESGHPTVGRERHPFPPGQRIGAAQGGVCRAEAFHGRCCHRCLLLIPLCPPHTLYFASKGARGWPAATPPGSHPSWVQFCPALAGCKRCVSHLHSRARALWLMAGTALKTNILFFFSFLIKENITSPRFTQ